MAKTRKTILNREPDNELYTPQCVLDWLPFRPDLDPAWSWQSNVLPKYYFDKETDGLKSSWNIPDVKHVWINPPYEDIQVWIRKCANEATEGRVVIALIQSKPGERAWMDSIWPRARSVGFLKGRLKHDRPFCLPSQAGTFGSALVLWGSPEDCDPIVEQIKQRAKGHKHEPVWVKVDR